MHEALSAYYVDPRRQFLGPVVPATDALCPDTVSFYLYAKDFVQGANWHWLGFHYNSPPPQRDMWAFAECCVRAERKVPGLGVRYVHALAELGGPERDQGRYEQMLQLFAEVLVIDRVLAMPWSEEASYEFEPVGENGKRPEFRVLSDGGAFLFELKCPSLLSHQQRRSRNGLQLPARLTHEAVEQIRQRDPDVVLPRDNPVKDFLVSAQEKFEGFDRAYGANILVIVWDDFIYEPMTSLLYERAGLLTEQSFHRDERGAVKYPNVDMVICLRHLNVFQEGLAERAMPEDRRHFLDIGSNPFTPNVAIETPWGRACPDFILKALHAVPHTDETILHSAEYRTQEFVLWF